MQRLRTLVIVALLALGASVGWVMAQGGSQPRTLTGSDYAEIQQLYARYAQGTDFGSADTWLNVFTPDATFRPTANQPNGGQAFVGREAMTKWRADNFAARKAEYHYRHWNASWLITPTPDGNAKGKVYWMAFNPTTRPIAVTDTGFYDDTYVRTPNGWRIKERNAHSDPQPAKPTR